MKVSNGRNGFSLQIENKIRSAHYTASGLRDLVLLGSINVPWLCTGIFSQVQESASWPLTHSHELLVELLKRWLQTTQPFILCLSSIYPSMIVLSSIYWSKYVDQASPEQFTCPSTYICSISNGHSKAFQFAMGYQKDLEENVIGHSV